MHVHFISASLSIKKSYKKAGFIMIFHIFALVVFGCIQIQAEIIFGEPFEINDGGEIKAKLFSFDTNENALMPWFEAMEYCQQRAMSPARVESAEENALVASYLNQYFSTSRVFWLGMTDWGQDGRFYWIQTGTIVGYNNFASGYPNGGLAESCAYVWGDGLWYDQYCTVREVRPLCQIITRNK